MRVHYYKTHYKTGLNEAENSFKVENRPQYIFADNLIVLILQTFHFEKKKNTIFIACYHFMPTYANF